MCFSANVSFTAGIVLSAIGVATIKKVQSPAQIAFASIPLIFAIQQIAEGFLWVSLPNPEYRTTQLIATYTFLFFAQVVWPLWIPLSIFLMEREPTRKKILKILVSVGLLLSVYLAYCLMAFPVEAKIMSHHIAYEQDYLTRVIVFGGLLYAFVTIGPLFVSRVKKMWLLAVTITASYIIANLLYEQYVLSVWCFFASIISVFIYVIILEISKSYKEKFIAGVQHIKAALD